MGQWARKFPALWKKYQKKDNNQTNKNTQLTEKDKAFEWRV